MAEKLVPALSYIVHNACDCGGAFIFTEQTAFNTFKHVCNLCEKNANFARTYPYIMCKEITG